MCLRYVATVGCQVFLAHSSVQDQHCFPTALVRWSLWVNMRTCCPQLLNPRQKQLILKRKEICKMVSNLIKVRKKPNSKDKPRHFVNVMVINFQSVWGKAAELAVCLDNHQPDILIGTETWLSGSISNSEILPSNYTLIHKDRKDAFGADGYGGVFIALKKRPHCHPQNRPWHWGWNSLGTDRDCRE